MRKVKQKKTDQKVDRYPDLALSEKHVALYFDSAQSMANK